MIKVIPSLVIVQIMVLPFMVFAQPLERSPLIPVENPATRYLSEAMRRKENIKAAVDESERVLPPTILTNENNTRAEIIQREKIIQNLKDSNILFEETPEGFIIVHPKGTDNKIIVTDKEITIIDHIGNVIQKFENSEVGRVYGGYVHGLFNYLIPFTITAGGVKYVGDKIGLWTAAKYAGRYVEPVASRVTVPVAVGYGIGRPAIYWYELAVTDPVRGYLEQMSHNNLRRLNNEIVKMENCVEDLEMLRPLTVMNKKYLNKEINEAMWQIEGGPCHDFYRNTHDIQKRMGKINNDLIFYKDSYTKNAAKHRERFAPKKDSGLKKWLLSIF